MRNICCPEKCLFWRKNTFFQFLIHRFLCRLFINMCRVHKFLRSLYRFLNCTYCLTDIIKSLTGNSMQHLSLRGEHYSLLKYKNGKKIAEGSDLMSASWLSLQRYHTCQSYIYWPPTPLCISLILPLYCVSLSCLCQVFFVFGANIVHAHVRCACEGGRSDH